jgi:hypothetical protein
MADAPDRETAKPLITLGGVEPLSISSGKIPASRASTCGRRRWASTWCFFWVCALLVDNGRLQDVYFYMSGVAA